MIFLHPDRLLDQRLMVEGGALWCCSTEKHKIHAELRLSNLVCLTPAGEETAFPESSDVRLFIKHKLFHG